jgi:hypothetical protein
MAERLNNEQKMLVQACVKTGMKPRDIAPLLKKEEETVKDYVEWLKASLKDNSLVDNDLSKVLFRKRAKKTRTKVKDLVETRTAAKKNKGVAIMTEGASTLGDEQSKKHRNTSRSAKNAIHTINEE